MIVGHPVGVDARSLRRGARDGAHRDRGHHRVVVHADDAAPHRPSPAARRVRPHGLRRAVVVVPRSRRRCCERARASHPQHPQLDGRRLRPDRVRGARHDQRGRGADRPSRSRPAGRCPRRARDPRRARHGAAGGRGRRDLRAGPDGDARLLAPSRGDGRGARSRAAGCAPATSAGSRAAASTSRTRKRDLILRGGENVYPIEIENRLEAHPDVAEVAVIGVDDEVLGQEVKAVVVPKPGATLDPEELRAFCAETLAYYKVPAHWEIRVGAAPAQRARARWSRPVLTRARRRCSSSEE